MAPLLCGSWSYGCAFALQYTWCGCVDTLAGLAMGSPMPLAVCTVQVIKSIGARCWSAVGAAGCRCGCRWVQLGVGMGAADRSVHRTRHVTVAEAGIRRCTNTGRRWPAAVCAHRPRGLDTQTTGRRVQGSRDSGPCGARDLFVRDPPSVRSAPVDWSLIEPRYTSRKN